MHHLATVLLTSNHGPYIASDEVQQQWNKICWKIVLQVAEQRIKNFIYHDDLNDIPRRLTQVDNKVNNNYILNQRWRESDELFKDICRGLKKQRATTIPLQNTERMFIPVPFGEIIERPHEQEEVKDKAVISSKILPRSLSTESQSDWIEPVMHLYSSKNYQSQEREKVLDAFRLLQMNPSIQKVVVSLSSDRAVWDAVMKNEVVQEFKKSFYEAESKPKEADEGDDHPANGILKWIVNAKAKIMEVLDKIGRHLSQIFHSHGAKDEDDVFHSVLQSSFMLSILVFIVVVMNRVQKS